MSNNIGKKTTFWQLVKKGITIPTLQRDYIYGAGTEKTEEVLTSMLGTFKTALETGREETLDFVYGCDAKDKKFMPLDGQQRLTTLFLLHFYAAVSGKIADNDIAALLQFSYATRNTTVAFCRDLLIGQKDKLAEVIVTEKDSATPISTYLRDLNSFRGAFYVDPSIVSMLNVLDRIHNTFKDCGALWDKLTSDECPINFYLLDFGIFDLSDDLYNKMNSRGKPLSEFEIVKAKIHKLIKAYNPKLADMIAVKFDTSWMQYVWELLDKTEDLKSVDPAFINLLQYLLRGLDFIVGDCEPEQKNESEPARHKFPRLDDSRLKAKLSSGAKIKALDVFMDTMAAGASSLPEKIKKGYKNDITSALKGELNFNEELRIYAVFWGLYLGLEKMPEEFNFRFRHVNNLIKNSEDRIREKFMHGALRDVRLIMQGKIQTSIPKQLNKNSWDEEKAKDKNRQVWATLFAYEDIDEINGTLSMMSEGLSASQSMDLDDDAFVLSLKTRLMKAEKFFKKTMKDEATRRAALLSVGDYSMCKYYTSNNIRYHEPAYRYLGIIRTSWRNFTGFHRYSERHRFLEVIDKIDIDSELVPNYGTDTENWRYYVIKYANHLSVAYSAPDYGYLYFPQAVATNVFNAEDSNLDVAVLQSTYYSDNNVAWKMMNLIVEKEFSSRYGKEYIFSLDTHGASPIMLSSIAPDVKLDMEPDGWHIYGIDSSILNAIGIPNTEVGTYGGDDNGQSEIIKNNLIEHVTGVDYVTEAGKIFQKLSLRYPCLKL